MSFALPLFQTYHDMMVDFAAFLRMAQAYLTSAGSPSGSESAAKMAAPTEEHQKRHDALSIHLDTVTKALQDLEILHGSIPQFFEASAQPPWMTTQESMYQIARTAMQTPPAIHDDAGFDSALRWYRKHFYALPELPLSVFPPMQGQPDDRKIVVQTNEPLGSGGFGVIHLGYEIVSQRKVVLKSYRKAVVDDKDEDTFLKEANRWSEFNHENVLQFLGKLYSDDSTLYLVAPYAPHGSVIAYLEQNPGESRGRLIGQLARGIQHIHSRDFVHGDIKGANALVSPAGTIWLCDFGTTKKEGVTTSNWRKGHGSELWRRLDVINGAKKTKASDIYSLGMTIAEVITGQPPLSDLLPDMDSPAFAVELHKILEKGQRPHITPLTNGTENYRPLWDLAQVCWVPLDQKDKRIPPTIEAVLTHLKDNGITD